MNQEVSQRGFQRLFQNNIVRGIILFFAVVGFLSFFYVFFAWQPFLSLRGISSLNKLAQVGSGLVGADKNLSGVSDLKTGIDLLAQGIVNDIPRGKDWRIAITDFSDIQDVTSNFGRYVADELAAKLGQEKTLSVIDRARLKEVLEEKGAGMRSLLNPVEGRELRNILGINAIIVGSISDLGDSVEVNARFVDVSSDKIVSAVSERIFKDDAISQMLKEGRTEEPKRKVLPPQVSESPNMLTFRYPQTVHTEVAIDVTLVSCQIEEIHIICRILAFNGGRKDRNLYITKRTSYLVGASGRRYHLERTDIVGEPPPTRGGILQTNGWDFPSGIRQAFDLTFATQQGIDDNKIATIVIEFGSYPGGRGFPDKPKVVFQKQ